MKGIQKMLDTARPWFGVGGRFAVLKPVFDAADHFFFSHLEKTTCAPYGRDPIDVKRYMSMVILALLPAFLASLYFFGPRVLLLVFVSYLAGGLVEVLFAVVRKHEINEGFLVTGFIFPLVLPPGTPLWMVAVGIVFGVLVGKEIFGGTGRNLFNAALVGRCFLTLAYPARMAAGWIAPGPEKWLQLRDSLLLTDAVTVATPLGLAKNGIMTGIRDLFVGSVGGCVGETSVLAILIGAVFLLLMGIASWRTIAGGMLSITGLAWGLNQFGATAVAAPVFQLTAGGWMFGIVFMATDPVSGPVTLSARWAYGILIGALTVLIRSYSGFVEGVMFAILFGNICAPLMDAAVIRIKSSRYQAERRWR